MVGGVCVCVCVQEAQRFFVLTQTDSRWKEHLQAIKFLQQAVGLRGYAQVWLLLIAHFVHVDWRMEVAVIFCRSCGPPQLCCRAGFSVLKEPCCRTHLPPLCHWLTGLWKRFSPRSFTFHVLWPNSSPWAHESSIDSGIWRCSRWPLQVS